MIPLATILGITAATVLILSGYLLGAKQGFRVREDLREIALQKAVEQRRLSEQLELFKNKDIMVNSLRSIVEQTLTPLTQRERLSSALSEFEPDSGDRSNLVLLLDQIAEKGQFWAVALHDEQGLPLAASSNAKNLDRLAAISALVVLFAERIGGDSGPTPLSLMVHDEANMATLCRIFRVGEYKLLLSAVATGTQLTPSSLDPALAKVGSVLSTKHS